MLEFNYFDIERVIDNNIQGVTVQIQFSDDVNVISDEFVDSEHDDITISTNGKKGVYFNFGYAKGIGHELKKIKTDIKNGYIRENYSDPHEIVKVIVIMSNETSNKVKIVNW